MTNTDKNTPPIAAQRRTSRPRALLGGKITYSEGEISFDCTIRDLSPTGARILLKKGQWLPPSVWLIDLKAQIAYEAKLAWSRNPEFGLAFSRSLPLKDITDPSLSFLKRIGVVMPKG